MTATLDLWPIGNCQVSALIDGSRPVRLGLPAAGRWRSGVLLAARRRPRDIRRMPMASGRSSSPARVDDQQNLSAQYPGAGDPPRRRARQCGGNHRFLPALSSKGSNVPPGRVRPDRQAGRRKPADPRSAAPVDRLGRGTGRAHPRLEPYPLSLSPTRSCACPPTAPVGWIEEERNSSASSGRCISSSARTKAFRTRSARRSTRCSTRRSTAGATGCAGLPPRPNGRRR